MSTRKPTIADVIRLTAQEYGIPPEAIINPRRLAEARKVAMLVAKRRTGRSMEAIARQFGMHFESVKANLKASRTSRDVCEAANRIEECLGPADGVAPLEIPPPKKLHFTRDKCGPVTGDIIERLAKRQAIAIEAVGCLRMWTARKKLRPLGIEVTTKDGLYFLDKENKAKLRAILAEEPRDEAA